MSAVGDGQPTSSLDGFGEQSLRAVEGTQKQFETALKDLLGSLGKKLSSNDSAMGHDALRFLTFRLDFNGFYDGKFQQDGAEAL